MVALGLPTTPQGLIPVVAATAWYAARFNNGEDFALGDAESAAAPTPEDIELFDIIQGEIDKAVAGAKEVAVGEHVQRILTAPGARPLMNMLTRMMPPEYAYLASQAVMVWLVFGYGRSIDFDMELARPAFDRQLDFAGLDARFRDVVRDLVSQFELQRSRTVAAQRD